MNLEKLRAMPHWSYSAFQTYLTCPLKFKFRYIDNAEPERTAACFPFGRAIHAALTERARIGRDMSVREVVDVFEDVFKVETDAAVNLSYKAGESYDSLIETGIKMLEVACENWIDDFAVQRVAESFSVAVPGLSKPLIGEFDCVVTDGHDTCIVDWKTASTKWPMGKADRDLQAAVFCYAYKAMYHHNPLFRFDVITKAKTPTVSNHYTVRTQDELDRFVHLANAIEYSVNAGCFYPNDTGFSCAECPYADRCKKWCHSPKTACLNHSGRDSV